MNIIEMREIKKTYENNTNVLKDITLSIKKGDIFGLVGRSGSGKSTLMRCINGLIKYDEGSLLVYEKEIKNFDKKELRNFRKNIGMISQHFSLLERKSVFQNIALPMECWGYKKDEINDKVGQLLKLVDLENKKNSKPRQLSGGQKQRVAIARALAMNPDILLCDEATSALDPNTTNSILQLLYKINKELNITILLVTHQMEVVRKICKNMAIIEDGEIKVLGDVKEIFEQNPKPLQRLLGIDEDENLIIKGEN